MHFFRRRSAEREVKVLAEKVLEGRAGRRRRKRSRILNSEKRKVGFQGDFKIFILWF